MQVLKADTEVIVHIGPFPDVGDGFTPQTDIDISGTNEAELLKHGQTATVDISGNTWAAITDVRGWYNLTLTAGNLDTEGMLDVVVQDDSDCLPVFTRFMVMNAPAYDALYAAAGTDYLPVDLLQMGGVAQSATDLKDFADAGYDPATDKVTGVKLADTTTTNSDMLTAAAVKTQVDSALSDIHLDHLLAAAYDPASKPGAADALLNEIVENDGGVSRFTENALEQAPSGTGGDATAANQTKMIQLLAGKWAIISNQLIMYDSDGTTPLYTFDLTRDGEATEFNPDLRSPV